VTWIVVSCIIGVVSGDARYGWGAFWGILIWYFFTGPQQG
jgi:hypothetical protein